MAAVTNATPQVGDLIDTAKQELEPPGRVPSGWFDQQRVGRCHPEADSTFVNVVDASFLAEHNRHPRVRRAIDRHLAPEYDLDAAAILLRLHLGRPVTQAVSAVVWDGEAHGIRYLSRLDLTEECWAIFDRTNVEFEAPQRLDPSDAVHRAAVRSAAELLELEVPTDWQ